MNMIICAGLLNLMHHLWEPHRLLASENDQDYYGDLTFSGGEGMSWVISTRLLSCW